MKSKTIYKQILINILVPVFTSFLVLALVNYRYTQKLMLDFYEEKNYVIYDEIKHLIELQEVALSLLENNLSVKMENYSKILAEKYFIETKNIESVDLNRVRNEMGLNPSLEDLYVINKNGIVINTTYEKDLGLNFFDFGEDHKNYLLGIFEKGKFVNERFAIEGSTKRFRKYTYQPTKDGNYIIEIGIYSQKADDIIDLIRGYLAKISAKHSNIKNVNLIIGRDAPFAVDRTFDIRPKHLEIIKQVYDKKENFTLSEENGTRTLKYEYIYMDRKNTDLYKDAVIQIVSDATYEKLFLRNELFKSFLFFGITSLLVLLLVYKKTQSITLPIEQLVNKMDSITEGNLKERAEIQGAFEINKLAKHFNLMLEKIEHRSIENQLQQEEIKAQAEQLSLINTELEKLSVVASETDNGISIYNQDGTIEWVNAGFEKIYGFTFSEIAFNIGANIRDFSNNPDIELLVNICLKTKQSIDFETQAMSKTGNTIWVQTTLTPILDSNNQVQRLIAIDSNISFQKQIEEKLRQKNKDITDSIAYAKKIQEAIMPRMSVIKSTFPESFVYFKPKGIVSGDFYWFNRQGNKVVFAAVDCTGHGIPGALISVLGVAYLNEIISRNIIISGGKLEITPSEILDILRDNVINALQQTGKQGESKDGMDMGLCIFDTETYELQFAGAYNPMFYLQDAELDVIKADKMPISIYTGAKKQFTNHSIQAKPGDILYLASDGYSDQFGGAGGKKFLSKHFKQLLLDICEMPLDEQYKTLHQTMQSWQGDLEQVDDILVIGIKIPEKNVVDDIHMYKSWKGKKILVADEKNESYRAIQESLNVTEIDLIWIKNFDETFHYFDKDNLIDAVLLDIDMVKKNGNKMIKKIRRFNDEIPLIIQTPDINKDLVSYSAYRTDFINRPHDKQELLNILKKYFSS